MGIIEKAISLANGKSVRDRPAERPELAGATAVRPEHQDLATTREGTDRPDSQERHGQPPSQIANEPAARKSSQTVQVDVERLTAMGMVTPATTGTRISEEFRLIKRPLLTNAFSYGPGAAPKRNLVMVTSAVAGEGKTFSSINLAMSIAMERDRRVLLIDADLQRPNVAQVLGISTDRGLTDVMEDPSLDLSELLLQTNIPRLSVLPAGRRHQYGTELLASDAMKDLVEELSERYPDRLVIFDSPPLLAATQAVVLASLAGQIVVVVAAGSTSQGVVSEALALLDAEKPVGLILNRYPRVFQSEYYYG
ncbi:MAG: hypothetical protein B7Z66_07985 [Chromatiales bacterium 21-64-14]|nr:MAG: hypothetical protein B7Z66_07985 [Chromatiales bacterium 21-64-14]HQU16080.1 XrtA-associated tyrosine autokinase [Gammaproteobacteria bacterium]